VIICTIQGPEPVNIAVALLLPSVVTFLSSARSPSGETMMCAVNPLPVALFDLTASFASKINSLAHVVVSRRRLQPPCSRLPCRQIQRRHTPRDSRIPTPGNAAAWLSVTITILFAVAMLLA